MHLSHPKFYNNVSKDICDSSRIFSDNGIVNFQHDITFGNGEISMISPHPEVFEFYNINKPPIAHTDNSGRVLANGIYLDKVMENKHQEQSKLMSLYLELMRKNNINSGKSYVHYVSRENDCQHCYTLFFDMPYNDFLHFIINNGARLQDVVYNYNTAAKDIILEAKTKENRIILPNSSDFFSQNIASNSCENTKKICVLHKNTNLPTHLSLQRSQCLMHLAQGKSVKEIARTMKLTPKTIAHYLELLRKELGCRSSKELIAFYSDQL